MYMRNSSKKRKYLIVKLFGTRSCDGSLYVCSCRYNGCINRRDVHIMTLSPSRLDAIRWASSLSSMVEGKIPCSTVLWTYRSSGAGRLMWHPAKPLLENRVKFVHCIVIIMNCLSKTNFENLFLF